MRAQCRFRSPELQVRVALDTVQLGDDVEFLLELLLAERGRHAYVGVAARNAIGEVPIFEFCTDKMELGDH